MTMVTGARLSILLVVLSVVACSGGTPATGGPPGGTFTPPADATATPATGGGATVAPPPAQGLDACGIVTPTEVEAVFESAVTAESGGEPLDGQSICTFRTADGDGILYTAYNSDGQIGFDAWKTDSEAQPVPGLGDEAFFHPTIGVLVRRGTETFQFHPLGDVSPEEAATLAVEVAQAASARF